MILRLKLMFQMFALIELIDTFVKYPYEAIEMAVF